MHCVGYMHRDPSAPNILRSEEGLGVLSDLEYAKRLSDETPAHVGRTVCRPSIPTPAFLTMIQGHPELRCYRSHLGSVSDGTYSRQSEPQGLLRALHLGQPAHTPHAGVEPHFHSYSVEDVRAA